MAKIRMTDAKRRKLTMALPKAHRESEVREIVRTVNHRPMAEQVQIVAMRTGVTYTESELRVIIGKA